MDQFFLPGSEPGRLTFPAALAAGFFFSPGRVSLWWSLAVFYSFKLHGVPSFLFWHNFPARPPFGGTECTGIDVRGDATVAAGSRKGGLPLRNKV